MRLRPERSAHRCIHPGHRPDVTVCALIHYFSTLNTATNLTNLASVLFHSSDAQNGVLFSLPIRAFLAERLPAGRPTFHTKRIRALNPLLIYARPLSRRIFHAG